MGYLESDNQQQLWNKQHATRGANVESGVLRFVPNELAITLNKHLKPQSRIMEVGSANGRDARYWASEGHYVAALDFSPVALGQLDQLAAEQGVRDLVDPIEWDVSNGTLPSPKNGLMDAFYSRSALHVDDATMSNLAGGIDEVLNPGGLIMIEGKSPDDTKIARSHLLEGNLALDPFENGHLRRVWTEEFMEEMCRQMGWDILDLSHRIETWEKTPATFMRLMARKA